MSDQQINLLNGSTTHVADVATGTSQLLTPGVVYTLQALSADTYFGFGVSSAAAITDGNASHGELLVASSPPRVQVIVDSNTAYVGCSGGTLRIRKSQWTP